jgi:hypothetical protein
MKCTNCGTASSPGDRFCGNCGHAISPETSEATVIDPGLDPARASLNTLVLGLQDRVPGSFLTALSTLAAPPTGDDPHLVVVGQRSRDRGPLIEALSAEAPPLGFKVVDTPPLDADPEVFVDAILPQISQANVVLVALTAAQLLSLTERRLIRSLLAIAPVPTALVVTRMDAAESAEDHVEIEDRVNGFAARLGGDVGVLLLPHFESDGSADLKTLRSWIAEAAVRGQARATDIWWAQVDGLLQHVLALVPEGKEPSVSLPSLDRLEREVAIAHRAALTAARNIVQSRLLDVRVSANRWFLELSAERRVHEGASRLLAEVESTGPEALRSYAHQLKADLESAGPAMLRDTAEASADAPGPPLHAATPQLRARHKDRSAVVVGAAVAAGLGLLLVPTAPLWLAVAGVGVAGASVGVAHRARAQRLTALNRAHAAELKTWLDTVECETIAWLDTNAEAAHAAVRVKLASLHSEASTFLKDPNTELHDTILAWRADWKLPKLPES